MDSRLINELSERLSALVPAANELRQETRAKIEQALKTGLSDLDVLTRDKPLDSSLLRLAPAKMLNCRFDPVRQNP